MKRKAKLYGPVLLAALLCALVFATGALKKPKIFENITTDYMAFQKKAAPVFSGGRRRIRRDSDGKAGLDASARGRIPPQMDD